MASGIVIDPGSPLVPANLSGVKIMDLPLRESDDITGDERLPYADEDGNGALKISDILAPLESAAIKAVNYEQLDNVGRIPPSQDAIPEIFKVLNANGDTIMGVGVMIQFSTWNGQANRQVIITTLIPNSDGVFTGAYGRDCVIYSRQYGFYSSHPAYRQWTHWEKISVSEKDINNKFVPITEADYDALSSKDDNSFYFIYEEEEQ